MDGIKGDCLTSFLEGVSCESGRSQFNSETFLLSLSPSLLWLDQPALVIGEVKRWSLERLVLFDGL